MTTTIALPPNPDKGFLTPLRIELTASGLWVLTEQLVWRGSDGDILVVPAGSETDFASVPRWLQALLPSADPRVVRAAVVHDFLCRELNEYHRDLVRWRRGLEFSLISGLESCFERPEMPAFSAVDADGVFEKIMRDEGAGAIMQSTGYLGVRLGALANPARRPGWHTTARRVFSLLFCYLIVLLAALALIGLVVPW